MPRTTPRTTPTQKTCRLCKLIKDRDQFVRHDGHKDGLQTRCKACTNETAKNRRAKARQKDSQNVPDVSPMSTIAPPPKPATKVKTELVIDVPGIFEIQNRGKNYTSYNFTSPVDNSTFSFPSFSEARQARKSMMAIFEQQSKFDGVQRQSTGRPAAEIFDESA